MRRLEGFKWFDRDRRGNDGKNVKGSGKLTATGVRVCALVMSAVLAFSGQAYAQEERVVLDVCHKHVGDSTTGTGCYSKAVTHEHEGNVSEGGGCYELPIYHVHTGDEEQGGGCFAQEVYHVHEGDTVTGGSCYETAVHHVHEGNEAEGGACYKTPVYHVHEGNTATGGACYQTKVYHQHKGNAQSGGGCYGTAKYHAHTGNEGTGGGCYNQPIYHSHGGDAANGGACYEPVYHQHTESCYQEAECTVTYVGNFQVESSKEDECYHHGITSHLYFTADFQHENCGAGRTNESHYICGTCNYRNKSHNYQKLVCGKDETTVEGYRLACQKTEQTVEKWQIGCGKTEQTVESYAINCGKTESTVESYNKSCSKSGTDVDRYEKSCGKTQETIEGYDLSCTKTAETVDSYERNCGKDESYIDAYALSCDKTEETIECYQVGCEKSEETVYGTLALWNATPGWTKETVMLKAAYAEYEKLLELEEVPFRWEGEAIEDNQEKGESVSVTENRTYRVHLLAKNQELADKELVLDIEVKNIDRTAPVIQNIAYEKEKTVKSNTITVDAKDVQPDGSDGSGLAPEAYSFDGGKTWNAENQHIMTENGIVIIAVRDNCGNVEEASVEVTNIGDEDDDDEDDEDDGDDDDDDDGGDDSEDDGDDDSEEDSEDDGDDDSGDDSEDDGDDDTGEDSDDDDGNTGDDSEDDNGGDDGSNGDDSKDDPEDNTGNDPDKIKDAKKIPEDTSKAEPDTTPATPGDKDRIKDIKKDTPITIKELPKKTREVEQEETQVEPEVLMAEPENTIQPKQLKRNSVTEVVVKAVVFTMSSVALMAGIMYLIYILCRSIRVYHQDGEGNSHYAGSCIMRATKDGFEVRIPDMILEQSATGQFTLRPGSLFVQRHKGDELMVIAGKRKESVWIEREIQLRI